MLYVVKKVESHEFFYTHWPPGTEVFIQHFVIHVAVR